MADYQSMEQWLAAPARPNKHSKYAIIKISDT
jgi:hypothetical protein